MRGAYRIVVSLLVMTFLLVSPRHVVDAKTKVVVQPEKAGQSVGRRIFKFFKAKKESVSEDEAAAREADSGTYGDEVEAALYDAVTSRLGVPYRLSGTDDRGYDCSGFIWRVFQEAGVEFDRTPARMLWEQFPEARDADRTRFGTLVFFDGLSHVGIVRDAHSFYHASSSQGVVRSYFSANKGYWRNRITGFRRVVPGETIAPPPLRWQTKGKWGLRPVRPREAEADLFPALERIAMTEGHEKKKKKRERPRE